MNAAKIGRSATALAILLFCSEAWSFVSTAPTSLQASAKQGISVETNLFPMLLGNIAALAQKGTAGVAPSFTLGIPVSHTLELLGTLSFWTGFSRINDRISYGPTQSAIRESHTAGGFALGVRYAFHRNLNESGFFIQAKTGMTFGQDYRTSADRVLEEGSSLGVNVSVEALVGYQYYLTKWLYASGAIGAGAFITVRESILPDGDSSVQYPIQPSLAVSIGARF